MVARSCTTEMIEVGFTLLVDFEELWEYLLSTMTREIMVLL